MQHQVVSGSLLLKFTAMKYVYTTFLFSVLLSPAMAQLNFGGGYMLSAPQGKMNDNINPAHSLVIGSLYRLPGRLQQFSIGVEAALGTYAQVNKEQTFVFRDGTRTITNVNYSSNTWQANAALRFDLLKRSNITPYLAARMGYSRFYSNIRIDDPHDVDGCKPLDRKTLLKDGTLFGGGGAGVKVDMATFLGNGYDRGFSWFDFGVQYAAGGNVRYINTKKLRSEAPPAGNGDGATPLNVQFLNASTQNIHEHQVAEVYNSPLRMLQFSLSFYKSF